MGSSVHAGVANPLLRHPRTAACVCLADCMRTDFAFGFYKYNSNPWLTFPSSEVAVPLES